MASVESMQPLLHRLISQTLQVTLDPGELKTNGGRHYRYLECLADELAAERAPLQFSTEILDRIYLSVLFSWSSGPTDTSDSTSAGCIFDYLLMVYVNIQARSEPSAPAILVNTLDELKRLTMNYSGLILRMPDMFPQSAKAMDRGPLLLLDRLEQNALPPHFLADFVKYNRENFEDVQNVIGSCLWSLRGRLCALALDESSLWRPVFDLLMHFLSAHKLIGHFFLDTATSFSRQALWNMCGSDYERDAFLGPIFGFGFSLNHTNSPTWRQSSSMATKYFSGVKGRSVHELETSFYHLRTALNLLHDKLYTLLYAFAKISKEQMLREIAGLVLGTSNASRAKIMASGAVAGQGGHASDMFMWNWWAVLVRFCEPFIAHHGKIASIDSDYLIKGRLHTEYAKLNCILATPQELDLYIKEAEKRPAQRRDAAFNFITECFFLTLESVRIGVLPIIQAYYDLNKSIRDLQAHLATLEEGSSSTSALPTSSINSIMMARVKDRMDVETATKMAMDVWLCDEQSLANLNQYVQFLIQWLLCIVAKDKEPAIQSASIHFYKHCLPWSRQDDTVPVQWAVLPEFIIDVIAEIYLFYLRAAIHVTHAFPPSVYLTEGFAVFVTGLLASDQPSYVKNPYLIAKFVEILYIMAANVNQDEMNGPSRNLSNTLLMFFGNACMIDFLIPSLMRFYIRVESTGASSQFYDKFHIRAHIAEIFKALWHGLPAMKERMKQQAENVIVSKSDAHQSSIFVRFVNLLLNDTTYLLDESLSKLIQIHSIQTNNGSDSSSTTGADLSAANATLLLLERQTESYMRLANETVYMLSYLSADVREPFLRPEIIDRLAAMLNYHLVQLIGPRSMELKVTNPEKYHFRPKELLSTLIAIYLHLTRCNHPTGPAKCRDAKDDFLFVQAIAKDGRSYRKAYFMKALSICRKWGLCPPMHLDEFEHLIDRIESARTSEASEEEFYGEDIPEAFLDPLMATLMHDPVKLLTSGVTVDRPTITAHLLNDKTDPFNRAPLTLQAIVDDSELKSQIEAFKAERRHLQK